MGISCMTQGVQTGFFKYIEVWDQREMGGSFKREGTFVYPRLIHVDVWQKPTQFCKANSLQLKNKYIYI